MPSNITSGFMAMRSSQYNPDTFAGDDFAAEFHQSEWYAENQQDIDKQPLSGPGNVDCNSGTDSPYSSAHFSCTEQVASVWRLNAPPRSESSQRCRKGRKSVILTDTPEKKKKNAVENRKSRKV
jgi:hypothetical protein